MSYKDDVKFGIDESGKLTMTAIDYEDHKGMNPHAHDVDMGKPFSNFNKARGEGRNLTEEENEEYGSNATVTVQGK